MRRRRRWSLQARIALIAGVALAVTGIGVSTAAWLGLRHSLLGQADRDLDRLAAGPLTQLNPNMLATLPGPSPLSRGDDLRVQLLDPDGTASRPAGQPALPVTTADAHVAAGRALTARHTVDTDAGRFRVLTFRSTGGQAIQAGRSMRADDATLRQLALILAVLAGATAAGASFAGRLVAATGLQPVNRLTAAAVSVAATQDLKHPIDDDGDDEIARLAHAFNIMLAALDHARQAQQRLVEDAAHELRTPMASLHTNIEVLLRAGDRLTGVDRDNLLRDVRRQSDELGTLVAELVGLARADADDDPTVPLDLTELVAATVERAHIRSPAVQFRLTGTPAPVRGHPAALERMVLNLLDNAVKFGPPDGPVEVHVGVAGDRPARRAEIVVADHGPGIDPAEAELVFARFHRGPAAHAVPGSGLGLAIVAQVVADHGGTVDVGRRPGGGARLRVRLPLDTVADRMRSAPGITG